MGGVLSARSTMPCQFETSSCRTKRRPGSFEVHAWLMVAIRGTGRGGASSPVSSREASDSSPSGGLFGCGRGSSSRPFSRLVWAGFRWQSAPLWLGSQIG
jgi:hypothetical protein